ncbi:MAG TPA: ORF6N domain-containing protein [Bryobacteraceae bacterium]|nr:ORF6N domain-containing protein [Bryobacteraceae bacterium]
MATKRLVPFAQNPAQVARITHWIHLIRGQKVMLDTDLAELYGVPTKVFNQAVKRNRSRFPNDFMFQLKAAEARGLKSQILRSQIVTSSAAHGGRRYRPYAFTQEGVAMLSSVLKSDRAVLVNIAIMRAFVSLREVAATYTNLARKLAELEGRCDTHDAHIKLVFDTLKKLIHDPAQRRRRFGFV